MTIAVTVRLYSILRHRDGGTVDRLEVELPPTARVQDVLRALDVPAELEIVLALNGVPVPANTALADGDTLALIPAVAGGRLARPGAG